MGQRDVGASRCSIIGEIMKKKIEQVKQVEISGFQYNITIRIEETDNYDDDGNRLIEVSEAHEPHTRGATGAYKMIQVPEYMLRRYLDDGIQ